MGNVWVEFKKLIPEIRTYIGTVDSIDTTKGFSYITLVSGDTITARGTSVSVGDNCIVEGGKVVSKAPNLNTMTTEEIPVLS